MPYWAVKGRQQRGQVGLPQMSCYLATLRETHYIKIIKCHTGNYEQMYGLPDILNLFSLLNTGKISTPHFRTGKPDKVKRKARILEA